MLELTKLIESTRLICASNGHVKYICRFVLDFLIYSQLEGIELILDRTVRYQILTHTSTRSSDVRLV